MHLFKKVSDLIFTKGYLSPRGAFFYKAESSATQTYLNVAPLWKYIHKKSWSVVENLVIQKTNDIEKDLIVYTGTLGELTLPDYGVMIDDIPFERPINLYQEDYLSLFPVPWYFWKLVYDPISNKGDVFITVNNPHVRGLQDYHICRKPKVKYFRAFAAGVVRVRLAFSSAMFLAYACTVDDFVKYNNLTLRGLSAESVTQSLFGINHDEYPYTGISEMSFGHDRENNPSTSGHQHHTHDELR